MFGNLFQRARSVPVWVYAVLATTVLSSSAVGVATMYCKYNLWDCVQRLGWIKKTETIETQTEDEMKPTDLEIDD